MFPILKPGTQNKLNQNIWLFNGYIIVHIYESFEFTLAIKCQFLFAEFSYKMFHYENQAYSPVMKVVIFLIEVWETQ